MTGTAAARQNAATPARADLPRLGFLGVGWIGRHRMEAIARSGAAEIAALVDPSVDGLTAARAAAPGAAVLDSFDAMLAADLDGVVIATPSALHAEQSVRALERGLAVFCQKPLGRTAAETRRVVDAARAANRLLGVDLSYRYVTGARMIRDLIQDGALGRIYAADLVFHNAYGPDKAWFYDAALSGGGCLIDLGIHLVDLALWTLGHPPVTGASSRLFHHGQPVSNRSDAVEDYAVGRLDLADGGVIRMACSWNLPAGREAVIEAAFHGTRGGAVLRNVDGSFYDFAAERHHGTAREVLCTPPDDWGGRAAVDWAGRLAAGATFDDEAEQVVEAAQVLDRLYGGGEIGWEEAE
ncbi:MAG TPA: Gfo/Idh/MocA family oxidoreductase [Gemmatimonadales bacterium]|nr:Gfo/Idh/MocA family oxidoreductase [Gemmatimonadales bacterium]